MRTIAFGYSNRCNIKCRHCVAADAIPENITMDLIRAKELVGDMAVAKVQGVSFTAGEPLIYLDDITELIALCKEYGMYTRVVTNSFWAKTKDRADHYVAKLKDAGLSQLRLSYSRWHQENVPMTSVLNAAQSCQKNDLDYFISFITDFSKDDNEYEQYLRRHNLKFFPEPVIFAGRAKEFNRTPIHTDYQANCCPMNPYLAPNLEMYACCDAGSHFTRTNFFHLGNVNNSSIGELFTLSEGNRLYSHIRNMGISGLASFAGFKAREIVGYRKCELCAKLFNSRKLLETLEDQQSSGLNAWYR